MGRAERFRLSLFVGLLDRCVGFPLSMVAGDSHHENISMG